MRILMIYCQHDLHHIKLIKSMKSNVGAWQLLELENHTILSSLDYQFHVNSHSQLLANKNILFYIHTEMQ
jgi:hypothetical protein